MAYKLLVTPAAENQIDQAVAYYLENASKKAVFHTAQNPKEISINKA